MPPRRNTASKAKAASPKLPPLDGCHVALCGSFAGFTQATLKQHVEKLGGTTSNNVNPDTTHLIASAGHFDKPSVKVKAALGTCIPILTVQWLLDCVAYNTREQESPYLHSAGPSASHAAAATATATAASTQPSIVVPQVTPQVPVSAQPSAKSSRKRSAPVRDANTSAAPSPASPPPSKKAKNTGKSNTLVPVDEFCTLALTSVHVDDDGTIWDASLNQTNAAHNSNKFYIIQALRDQNGKFWVWTRWGRVGELGQKALLEGGSQENAEKLFKKKFKDKSGRRWEDRNENPVPGKYAYIEKSYEKDSDDEDAKNGDDGPAAPDNSKTSKEERSPPVCTLAKPIQNLMELIFNRQYFAATMSDLNYDANKLPLGKLSKTTISRGFQALKDLSALFDDPSLAQTVYSTNAPEAIENLSNLYYSLIPHAFGRNRPPIIQDYVLLKKEVELLESLGDMKDAELLMHADRAKSEDPIHPADKQFSGLGLKEMTPLESNSEEFKQLEKYLSASRGATHNVKYRVEDIFRIERDGEHDRLDNCPVPDSQKDTRLLWHGSRVTNFGGILNQGLRIAPPEAPVSGYMFGKGIYLADMSSKSANYCCSYSSGNTALLLLCEAELGSPIQTLVNASYTAGDDAKAKGMFSTWGQGRTGPSAWKDAGSIHKDLSGVKVPDVSQKPGPTNVPDASLLYNEYIVYDISQVRLRYLFRVHM